MKKVNREIKKQTETGIILIRNQISPGSIKRSYSTDFGKVCG